MLVTLGSVLYFFGVGRSRYVSQSSFIVRLPEAPSAVPGGTLLGGILAGPTMLGSLEDGRFLAVYLTSPEVMKRVFDKLPPDLVWPRTFNDPFAGLPKDSTIDQRLAFYRRQVQVVPQDLTGVINLRTVGLKSSSAYQLNKLLLEEAEQFMNQANQSISANQASFAEGEVKRARDRLNKITADYNAFKSAYREVSPESLAQVTNSLISQLESKLVDLKVQEASLKRQFRDPNAPEVAYVTDQVQELEKQIEEERIRSSTAEGKDVNRLQAEASKFETEILVATEALKAAINAADNSRQRSQQQVKFVVRLAEPLLAEEQSWDWRWQGFLATLGLMVVAWGVVSFALGINSRR
jgi:capsular polysaccharide transport system permease protein